MKKILIFLMSCSLMFYGCAEKKVIVKPEESKVMENAKVAIEEAKKDIADAKEVGADKYSKELLDSAESKLVVAEESFGKKDYEVALNFAKKSSEDAKLAKLKTLAGKAIEQAKNDIISAKEIKADEIATDLIKSAEENLQTAQASFENKDYAKALEYASKSSEDTNSAKKLVELSNKAKSLIEQAELDVGEAKKIGAEKSVQELVDTAIDNLKKALKSYEEKIFLKAIEYALKASDEAKAAKAACEAKKAQEQIYTVIKGDCLWNISKDGKNYGDPFMWPLIYKANKDKIKDPDLIYPNQEFNVPANYDEKDKNESKDAAKKAPYKKKK
ncbi:MAG: DUF4398 domain-containing protein [Candidatus Firestonebacteria bacterium]